jgi:iron complex outermembrane receptor protein
MEHEKQNRRTLASLYRYRVDRLPDYSGMKQQNIIGAELESEWQWPGDKTLGFSYTWQRAKDDQDNDMPNVPRNIGKLQLSYPLFDQKLRASLAVRHVGARKSLSDTEVDAYTISDLTFTSLQPFSGATLTLAIRNLFNTRYGHVAYTTNDSGVLEQEGRTLWFGLKYSPR